MTRWDEQEKEKSKSISGIFFFITIVFAIGFVLGMLLGLNFVVPDTAIPPVFGEEVTLYTSNLTTIHQITLYDGIGVNDSVVTSP